MAGCCAVRMGMASTIEHRPLLGGGGNGACSCSGATDGQPSAMGGERRQESAPEIAGVGVRVQCKCLIAWGGGWGAPGLGCRAGSMGARTQAKTA